MKRSHADYYFLILLLIQSNPFFFILISGEVPAVPLVFMIHVEGTLQYVGLLGDDVSVKHVPG